MAEKSLFSGLQSPFVMTARRAIHRRVKPSVQMARHGVRVPRPVRRQVFVCFEDEQATTLVAHLTRPPRRDLKQLGGSGRRDGGGGGGGEGHRY